MNDVFQLVSQYEPKGGQPAAIEQIKQGLLDGLCHQTLLGVTGSGKTFMMANIIQAQGRPAIILAPNKTLAAQIYGEMKSFFPQNAVEYFVSYYDYYQPEAYIPASNTYIEKDASVNEYIEQMRLSATKAILQRPDVIIVATVSAIYGLGDPNQYLSMVLHLTVGERIDQRAIIDRLTEMQYKRNDVSFERGCFRVRGEIIDIYPAESDKMGIRIELFDDEVEQLYEFDPLTGQLNRTIDRTTIFPKSHYVTHHSVVLNMMDDIKDELKARLKELRDANKLVEAQRLEERVNYDIEMMTQVGYCQGIENYSRYLSGTKPGEPPPTLMNYLPSNALLFIDESHVTCSQIGGMYRGDRSRKTTLVEYGFRLPSALDNRPLTFEEFEKLAPQTVYLSATPGSFELSQSDHVAECVVRPTGLVDPPIEVLPVDTQVDNLLSQIQRCVTQSHRVLVTTLTKKMAEDLTDYLSDHGVKVRYLHSDIGTVERMEIIHDLRKGVFDVLVGINLLREGLDIPEVALVAILDADKEGFLRSERSLIQTIGRAARNLHGRVIFYANHITASMQRAMDETQRRRDIQVAFNKAHGITPQGIQKAVKDTLNAQGVSMNQSEEISPLVKDVLSKSPKEIESMLEKMEKTMLTHAHALEFEEAAAIRDQIESIKSILYKQ